MSRLVDFLLGNPPLAGVEYFCGSEVRGRILKYEDIYNGVVAIRYKVLSDDYMTFRGFHFTYRVIRCKLERKFKSGKYDE